MRLTTWNVNGIRNSFSYPPWNALRTFPSMFDTLGADIVVMQELKIQRKDLRDDMVLLDGWDAYFSLPKHKKGYSGVGIYCRNAVCAPVKAEEGLLGVLKGSDGVAYRELPEDEAIGGYPSEMQVAEMGVDPAMLDAEGRCLVLEFPAFVLFGVYSPANSNGLRDDFRYGFITALDCRIRNLIKMGKRVVLVGDLNVSRDESDTAKAWEDCKKNGITHEEYISTPNRRIFNQLLVGGEVVGERDEGRENGVLWDTTRGFHPTRKGMYTHWEQKINARPGNFGSRIDFVLVTDSMRSWLKDANIQEGLLGSDHCPVYADFHERINMEDGEVATLDAMNPPGVFVDGQRREEWKLQSAPALSAKKMPEFDKRRTIAAMFSAGSTKSPSKPAVVANTNGATPSLDSAQLSTTTSMEAAITDTPTSQTASESADTVSSMKRKGSAPVKEKPSKKLKTEPTAPNGKGQQSLMGFFKTQEKSTNGTLSPSKSIEQASQQLPPPKPAANTITSPSADSSPEEPRDPPEPPSPEPSAEDITTAITKSETAQKNWNNLFTKPSPPMCEGHNEPCKSMLTKKKGSNQGRSFWMCARPLGPSGEKERGTGWRCGTFIWCSEWPKKGEGGG